MPFSSSQPSIAVPATETLWSWLFESEHSIARQNGASKGIRDGDTCTVISYSNMKDLSTLLSTSLTRKFKLCAGDQLMIACENSVWYPVVMFAGLRIGSIVSAVSPKYLVDEMVHTMKICCPKITVVDKESYTETLKAAKILGIPESSIICIESLAGLPSIQDLILEVKSEGREPVSKWEFSASQTSQNTCALICFSSGTTGLPKAAMISNANLIAQSYQVKTNRGYSTCGVMFSPLPLYHITGLLQIMILPIFLNQDVVIIRKFNLPKMLAMVTRYQCEELWLVPPILIRMVNDPVVSKYDLGHVTQFNTGAAPLSSQIIEALTEKFPHAVIKQHWGMTESTSCITATPVALLENMYAHTVGTVVSSTTIKIVNPETGREVVLDEPGEILARGPQIFMGYLKNDVATRQAIDEDGYLHTGDLGSIDANGLVTIHDRIKELIKVKGVGVAPAELEDTLHGHTAVKDVAVIGIRDQLSGEIPKAFVVLQPGVPRNSVTAAELVEYVKSKVARPKWIDGGVDFLDEIPKSASGKILRRILKDQLKKHEETQRRASRL